MWQGSLGFRTNNQEEWPLGDQGWWKERPPGSAEMGPGRVWQGHSLRGTPPTHPTEASAGPCCSQRPPLWGTIPHKLSLLGKGRGQGLLAGGPTAEKAREALRTPCPQDGRQCQGHPGRWGAARGRVSLRAGEALFTENWYFTLN